MPGITRRPRIGIVDVTKIQDNENRRSNIIWCLNCEKAGIHNRMGKRIYPDIKTVDANGIVTYEKPVIPADADQWLQCHACGEIIPEPFARGEGEIQVSSEYEEMEMDNPFEFGHVIIEPVGEPRKIDRSKLQNLQQKKIRRKQLEEIKDSDLKKELSEGGEIIDYTATRL